MANIKQIITETYRETRSPQKVWETIKTMEGYRHLRAPYWTEQIWRNGGRVRNYKSPLGRVLAEVLDRPELRRTFGQYGAAWPRTKCSEQEAEAIAAEIIAALDAM